MCLCYLKPRCAHLLQQHQEADTHNTPTRGYLEPGPGRQLPWAPLLSLSLSLLRFLPILRTRPEKSKMALEDSPPPLPLILAEQLAPRFTLGCVHWLSV